MASEIVPPQMYNYGKTYFMGEEMSEILKNSSDEEYTEDKEEQTVKKVMYKLRKKLMTLKQMHFTEKKTEKKVAAASCTTKHTFSSKSGIQWQSKAFLVTKRKACNIVSANPVLQSDGKNIMSISEAFKLFISNQWWKKPALNHLRK
jgi:hypothetical protein